MPPKRTTNIELSDSELDELLSDDEEDKKPAAGAYGGQIPKSRLKTTSCKQLHDMIHNGTVELCPSYQRDVVWTEAKMIGLIQSLYLNFYIPPVVFAVEPDPETGEDKHICIDGKQRCSSIMDFMSGKIPFHSPNTNEKFWYVKSPKMGSRGKLCALAMKQRFDMIQIQVVEYDQISDAIQRDIFQRVQMGAPLSAAEKLQAIPGELTTWLNELLKKFVLEEDTLTDYMDWDVSRGKPFQNLASMAYMCWYTNSRKPVTPTDLKKWLLRSEDLDESFKQRMEVVLSLMIQIAINYKTVAFDVPGTTKAPRMSPVEIWFMGYIIYLRMGKSPMVALARQIGKLRIDTRAQFRDIFSNGPTVTFMYKWVEKLPVEKPTANQQVAALEWEHQAIPGSTSSAVAKKRKADQQQDDADPDYRVSASGPSNGSAAKSRRTAESSTTRSSVNRPAAPPPPPPAARLPPSSMDAAHGPYGDVHGGVNPYPVSHPAPYDQRAQQRSSNSVYGQAPSILTPNQQQQARSAQQPSWAQHPQAYQRR